MTGRPSSKAYDYLFRLLMVGDAGMYVRCVAMAALFN